MKRIAQLTFLVAFAVASCAAANSHAAVISVQPVVAGYYTTAFEPLPPPHLYSGPVVAQIDVYMEVLSLLPGEDSFGVAAFSLEIIDGYCRCDIEISEDAGGWIANNPTVDSNGPTPGGNVPLFSTNADVGADSLDLKGILVQMATGAFTNVNDPRRNVGELGSSLGVPILLGSAFFEWNRQGQGFITLNPLQVAVKQTNGLFATVEALPVQPASLGFCPEPSSLVLLGSCLAGLSFRRRAS